MRVSGLRVAPRHAEPSGGLVDVKKRIKTGHLGGRGSCTATVKCLTRYAVVQYLESVISDVKSRAIIKKFPGHLDSVFVQISDVQHRFIICLVIDIKS